MNIYSYEAKVLGKDVYISIAKKHNLFTQKHTKGRLKAFKCDIYKLMKG